MHAAAAPRNLDAEKVGQSVKPTETMEKQRGDNGQWGDNRQTMGDNLENTWETSGKEVGDNETIATIGRQLGGKVSRV
jgi:hypothetical protein